MKSIREHRTVKWNKLENRSPPYAKIISRTNEIIKTDHLEMFVSFLDKVGVYSFINVNSSNSLT